jgi:hypothetical protein
MSSYLNDLEAQQPPQETCDTCKPIRSTFNALTKMLGQSKVLTTVFILIPMVFMFIFLMYFEYGIQTIYFQGYPYQFEQFRKFFSPPVTLVVSMTFIAGGLSLVSVYFGFQNIIGMCSFVYSSIAYWALINTLIIVFCTYDYLNHTTIGYGFLTSSIVSIVWLFSSAVMDAHRKVVNETI